MADKHRDNDERKRQRDSARAQSLLTSGRAWINGQLAMLNSPLFRSHRESTRPHSLHVGGVLRIHRRKSSSTSLLIGMNHSKRGTSVFPEQLGWPRQLSVTS